MKKRVCAYARVSSNSRGQEHSFDFQSRYWDETLSNNPEYEYVGLFADKGISGKFAERRPQFMQMVNAIENHQIDLVFTKSVQRFARNTEELLSYVRMFRDMGVGVYFEKENINTLENQNDMFLTIAVAIAEDDLTRYSQNVLWTIQDKFKKGQPTANGRLFGFKMEVGKGTNFEIIENEAKIIRRIYSLYLEGASIPSIAKTLNSEGIKSPMGCEWHESSIERVLSNEKYCGDCLLQKSYKVKGIDVDNRGEKNQYYVENHHKPIVSKEIWNQVQQERLKRRNHKLYGRKIHPFPFTGLIICGHCGKHYRHKVNKSLYTKDFDVWVCSKSKNECPSIRVKDDELKDKFVSAYNEFVTMKYQGEEESLNQIELNKLTSEFDDLNRLKANGWISNTKFKEEASRLEKLMTPLKEKLMSLKLRKLTFQDFKTITIFTEEKVQKFLQEIVIDGIDINFKFYNGVVITRQIEHTRIYDKDKKKLIKEEK